MRGYRLRIVYSFLGLLKQWLKAEVGWKDCDRDTEPNDENEGVYVDLDIYEMLHCTSCVEVIDNSQIVSNQD